MCIPNCSSAEDQGKVRRRLSVMLESEYLREKENTWHIRNNFALRLSHRGGM